MIYKFSSKKMTYVLLISVPLIFACGIVPLAVAPVPTVTATALSATQTPTNAPETPTPIVYRVCVDSANVRWSGAGMEYPIYTVYERGHAVYDFGRQIASDGGEWIRISRALALYINMGLVCKL